MANNSKNIIVGAAAFYVSATETDDGVGTPLPTLTDGTTATAALEADANGATPKWRAVGYTENGVTVSYEPTYGDVVVDQLLDSALVFKSGMKVLVNTTFAEATLENLIVVWGQKEDTKSLDGSDNVVSIDGGSLGDYPHERSLAFVGGGPRKSVTTGTAPNQVTTVSPTERVYNVSRAIQTQTTAHDLKRDAATTLPVSFRCLPGDNGQYGAVRERALGAG